MRQELFSQTLLKRTATLMATVLFYETMAMPLAQAAVIAPPAAKSSPHLAIFNDDSTKVAAKNFKEAFRMPVSVGTLADSYAPSTAGRLIYHFQDVHNHVAAQTNLAEMVSQLEMYARKQGKNLVVAVEGVSGPVDSDTISRIPNQKNKEDVASALLRGGYLMGEEYAAITNAPGRIKLIGIETDSFYRRNVAARDSSRAARNRVLTAIKETRSQLEKLKRHNFSILLTTLEDKRLGVDAGTVSLTDYATFLANTSPSVVAAYPQLSRLAHVNVLEKNVDFDAVEKESQLLVTELTLANDNARVEKIMQDAESLKNGQLSALSYYSGLLKQTHKSYPTLENYVAYLRAADGIDADRLFDEVMAAEAQIAHSLIRHPLAQQLYDHLRWIENEEKFFSLNLIPQEWAQLKSNDADRVQARLLEIRSFINEQQMDLGYHFEQPAMNAADLSTAVKGASSFYEAASERSTVMVSNLERVIEENPASQSIVVFISGGFHTSDMTKLLRAKNYAYEVFRPQLETEVELSQEVNFPSRKVNYLRNPEAEANANAASALPAAVENPNPDTLGKLKDALEGQKKETGEPTASEVQPGTGGIGGVIKKAIDDLGNPNAPKEMITLLAGISVLVPVSILFSPIILVLAVMSFRNGGWAWKLYTRFSPNSNRIEQKDYAGTAMDATVAAEGARVRTIGTSFKGALFGKRVFTDVTTPAFVAVDVDMLADALSGDEALLFVQLEGQLNKAVSANGSSANVPFFSSSGNAALLAQAKTFIGKYQTQFPGIHFGFAEGADATNIQDIFAKAQFSATSLSPQNTFVLARKGSTPIQGAQNIDVFGVPHLALALFAYSHYKQGSAVLDDLVSLFKDYWPNLDMAGHLTQEIATELAAAIQA